eukprot:10884204-Alexandrium_andersonii.AAC.1
MERVRFIPDFRSVRAARTWQARCAGSPATHLGQARGGWRPVHWLAEVCVACAMDRTQSAGSKWCPYGWSRHAEYGVALDCVAS